MFEIQNYGSFIAAIIVFQTAPGPGTFTILNATGRNGIGAGFAAVAGTLLGDLLFMLAAVAGLAAVMNAYPALFHTLQWFGAIYLCWVGIQLLRSRSDSHDSDQNSKRKAWMYTRQAFAVSLTNPKVILFFVAFFPLFLRADSSVLTLAIMMAHVTTLSFLYQAGLVFMGNAAARKLASSPHARCFAKRFAGMAMIGFGVKLAVNNR